MVKMSSFADRERGDERIENRDTVGDDLFYEQFCIAAKEPPLEFAHMTNEHRGRQRGQSKWSR